MMAEALVAFGGNVGNVRATLDRAVAAFCDEGVRLLARSADYRTPPWGIKEQRWGPRPVDIDLLVYDDMILKEPHLTLPHPHLFDRAFVLVPLAEIAPEKVIAGTRMADALARVDTKGVVKLPPQSQ